MTTESSVLWQSNIITTVSSYLLRTKYLSLYADTDSIAILSQNDLSLYLGQQNIRGLKTGRTSPTNSELWAKAYVALHVLITCAVFGFLRNVCYHRYQIRKFTKSSTADSADASIGLRVRNNSGSDYLSAGLFFLCVWWERPRQAVETSSLDVGSTPLITSLYNTLTGMVWCGRQLSA